MEAVADNVAATCPLAFSGASGSVFLNTITALVAAHCAISDSSSWPADKAGDIIGRITEGVSYDFIVVGAGTAGSLVASKLSNDNPSSSILLIEAGDDPGVDSEIPGFFLTIQHSKNDWSYKTQLDGLACLGFQNNSCMWNKGKGMGGSSSMNAMLYIRGHPSDFDDWKSSYNADWAYDDLKYYFNLQEEKFNLSNPMETSDDGWYKVIDEAWKELKFTSHKYKNHEGLIGTKKCTLLIKNGKRLNTAKFLLEDANTVHVMKDTVVQNIIVDRKTKRATGIKVYSNGSTMEIKANKEVILSAGSIGSPQILMLSGIGPKKHLEEIGIDCFLDLPVGKNLQDHLIFPLHLKTNMNFVITSEMAQLFFLEYMLKKTGPMSNIGITDFFGFINTKNSSERPNIQFHHMYFTKNDAILIPPYVNNLRFKKEVKEIIMELNKEHDILGIYPTLLHPKSKGEILLADADWKSKPIIKPNYLKHPDDMQTLLEAIKFVNKLIATKAFKSMGLELLDIKLPSCTQFKFNTKPYWECYIRHMATTVYHPVGTVKMGSADDDSSVVDHNLLVHGMNNLRVVDSSIMPSIPGANTMASTLAIANKAVDLITKKYEIKSEL